MPVYLGCSYLVYVFYVSKSLLPRSRKLASKESDDYFKQKQISFKLTSRVLVGTQKSRTAGQDPKQHYPQKTLKMFSFWNRLSLS